MARSREWCVRLGAGAVTAGLVMTLAARANAQSADPPTVSPVAAPSQPRAAAGTHAPKRWTLGVRGGLAISSNASSGTGQLPANLSTVLTGPTGLAPARAVSSWFFGDGTVQLNDVTGIFGIARMSPLDPILEAAGVHYGPTGGLGVTLSRELALRWTVNVNLDVDLRSNSLSAVADSTVEEVRNAFVTSWQQFLQALGPTATPVVTAARTGTTSSGRQIDTTATLTYWLGRGTGHAKPFVEFGGGASTTTGGSLSATLAGDYQASYVGEILGSSQTVLVPIHQTDTVTVHWMNGGTRPVGVVGAGLDRPLSPTRGFRAEARFVFGSENQTTTLDATPNTPALTPPFAFAVFTRSGSVVLGNSPQVPLSLSGPALSGFKTFSASGMRVETTLSLAYYFRF